MSEVEPRTVSPKNRPTPPVEYLSDGRLRRWCSRIKKDGAQCRKAPIEGGTVCSKHGGRAPHIKAAAKARLENAADRMAAHLLGIADDRDLKSETRLAAIKDVLDRAGLGARAALDLTHQMKPWEEILDGVYRGPRRDVVDGEVVDDELADFDYDDGRSA